LIPALVVVLGLLTELLNLKGYVYVAGRDLEAVSAWAGGDWEGNGGREFHDRGMMPLVYRHRDHFVAGPILRWSYRVFPAFHSNAWSLFTLIVSGLVLAALESLSLVLLYRSGRRAALDVATRLKGAVFEQSVRLGADGLINRGVSMPQGLATAETQRVRAALTAWWRAVPRSIVLIVALFLLAMAANVWLTLAALVMAAMTWLLHRWLGNRAKARIRQCEEDAARETSTLLEQLRQVPLVTGYSVSSMPGEPLDDTLRRYRSAAFLSAASDVAVGPIVNLFVMAGIGLLLFLIGYNILQEPPGITLARTVVLGTSLICAYFPGRRLLRLSKELRSGDRAAEKIFAYLDREPSVLQTPNAQPLQRLARDVVLESVTLADASGAKMLDGATMTIPVGKRVALVATNREAPAAVAGLLLRFFDPAAGRVLFDGHDVRTVTLDSLRKQAVMVTGEGNLFTGTVSDNIACNDPQYTLLDVTDAAKQARAYNLVQQLPQGFSTIVGDGGLPLDAGQAFRIALARAALREPSLLAIQEPDAEFDETSAGHVIEALRRLGAGRAMLVLPMRIATLRSADLVYLLHEGKIVAEGKHADLLQSSDLYRHLTYVRFNPFRHTVK